MAEELLVSLNKRDPSCGLGFSLLGTPGFPPVIYDIAENSPAAESGKVEAGDVILKVNETDVKRYNTKEVLKCLRLSENPVVLKLKRDPNIKAKVRSYLSSPEFHRDLITENVAPGERKSSLSQQDRRDRDRELDDKFKNHVGSRDEDSPVPPPSQHPLPVNEVTRSQAIEDLENEPSAKNNHQQPRFEAFMMTGDRVLKLTRNQQVSLLPKHSRKIDSLLKHHHNNNNNYNHNYHSVPTSPIDTSDKSRNNHHHSKKSKHATDDDASSVTSSLTGTSPPSSIVTSTTGAAGHGHVTGGSSADAASSSYVVRTSKSEDHLQLNKNSNSLSTVSIDFDDDVTSSLNTLLCTRPDSEGEIDQRVWSYHTTDPTVKMKNSSSSVSNNSSENNGSSQNHSLSSPASPTSVSSSVMSSTSSSSSSAVERKKMHQQVQSSSGGGANNAGGAAGGGSNNQNISSSLVNNGGDLSQSEAISNISSPDFQEDSEILNSKDFNIEISDPSDSDSTLLVSESAKGGSCRLQRNETPHGETGDHRIVIQVKGRCSPKVNFRNNSRRGSHKEQDYSNSGEQPCYMTLNECDDEQLLALTKGAATLARAVSPPLPNSQSSNGLSEDESDVESLRSFHYSPKAVDHPSASRLAKRLFTLDGFKKSDVSRHLSKNNDFSRAVADEFLRYFTFEGDTLDVALRKFLKQFSLSGETQERERVLIHFSKRYLDCNPGTFKSQDAVHTLTCALMLLNSDLHGKIIGRKMTCSEFIENLAELNDGENFPKDILKSCYQAIKNFSLEWAVDDEAEDNGSMKGGVGLSNDNCQIIASDKGLFQSLSSTIEYKKGYVMRKCCMEPYGKKTPLGKRGWKMFYCTLRDFVLYLPKDEHGFRNLHNAIRIHHSLATKATDYRKKQHVFRLQTADQAEYLFQTSDSKELQSWVDTINFVCASFSAPPLPGGVGSQKKFQRPLLPTAYTKLNLREQMLSHDESLMRLEIELEKHRSHPPERGAKALIVQNYKEKDAYLHHELKRYRTYAWILRVKLSQYPELDQPSSLTESCIGEVGELEEEYCDDSVMTASSGKNSPSLNREQKKQKSPGKDKKPSDDLEK